MEAQSFSGLGTLLNKLSHHNIDTRLRSTKNLIFKSKNNLIAEIIENVSLSHQLFQGILQSFELTFQELNNDEITSLLKRKLEIQLQQLLDLVTQLCNIQCETFNNNLFSDILPILNSLVATDNIGKVLSNHAQRVMQCIQSIHTEDSVESSSICLKPLDDLGKVSLSTQSPLARNSNNSDFPSGGQEVLPPVGGTHLIGVGSGGLGRPGCILFTKLAMQGWQFPPFLFTETDEKMLFDIEVKVKMGHRLAGQLALDALYDFPANAMLQRVGLLESMLNLLPSSVATQNNGEFHSLQLDQKYSLHWFRVLIQRCICLFDQLLDGGLCSRIPPQLKHLQSSSLAAQMSHEMYAMRDPLHAGNQQQGEEEEGEEEASSLAPPMSWAACPSLSGIAFAAVAASLPLLAGNDVRVNADVLGLIYEALPFICDATEEMYGDGENIPLTTYNSIRLQHLLDRMEQVFTNLDKDSIIFQTQPDPTAELSGGNGIGEGTVQFALSLDLCSVLVRLLTLIVDDCSLELLLYPPSDSVPGQHDSKSFPTSVLFLGVSVVAVIKQMYSAQQFHDIFPRKLLLTILKGVDPSFLRSITLEDVARMSCRRVLSHHVWVDFETNGFHEVFGHLSDIFQYMVAAVSPDIGATIVLPTLIGKSCRVKLSNVLAGAFPVALSIVIHCSSPEEAAELEEKFDHLLQDMLFMCSADCKVDLSVAVEASLMLFLGMKKAGPNACEDDKEMFAIQEHLLLSFNSLRSSSYIPAVFEELQRILLKRISTLSFLCPYLANVILPRIAENAQSELFVKGENCSLRLLCCILEQFQSTLINSGISFISQDNENDLFSFVVFHLQLLLWKWFDDSTTTTRLQTSMKSLLVILKKYGVDDDMTERCFLKVYSAGLFSSQEHVRRWCFGEICASKLLTTTSGELNGLLRKQIGINPAYSENHLLASMNDPSVTTEMKKSSFTSHSKSSLSSHPDLHSLLDIAFGEKSEDVTIRSAAVKQLTTTVVKDSNLLVTLDVAVCADLITNLNDIISANCLVYLCDEESDDGKQLFVAHCAMLLRCVLLTVPALLSDVHMNIFPPFCESHSGMEGEKGAIYAPYVLQFVLLSHVVGWGSCKSQNSLTIFTLCCQDILRLWVLRPIDCKHCCSHSASSSSSCHEATILPRRSPADVTLPICYSSDFLAANLLMVSADVREKYFCPLVFEFSMCSMLPIGNCWENYLEGFTVHPFFSEDIDEDTNVTAESCDVFTSHSEILSIGLKDAKKNASFNEVLQLCLNMTLSAPDSRFLDPIMKSTFISSAFKIIQGFPSTKQDFSTLNLTLSVLRALVSGFNAQQQAHTHTILACEAEMLKMVDVIICSFGGVLRRFFTQEKEKISNVAYSFEDCQHSVILLLIDVLSMLTETWKYKKTAQSSSCDSASRDLSNFFPLLLDAFIGDMTHSRPRIQHASSLCLKALARYGSVSNESLYFSPQMITCPNDDNRRGRSQFETLIAIVKQLRNPNSMRESCSVISALRCLLILLKMDSTGLLVRQCRKSLGCEGLVRYTRDRRGIVRHMAIELMCSIHCSPNNMSASQRILNLGDGISPVTARDDENENSNENEEGNDHVNATADVVVADDSVNMDMAETNLRVVAADSSEASSIRCLSLRFLVLQAVAKKLIMPIRDELIRFILPIVSELLDYSYCQPSVEIVISCLRLLHSILQTSVDTGSIAKVIGLISLLKIVPKIVTILQPGYLISLFKDAKFRTYRHSLESSNNNLEFSFGGWKRRELRFLDGQQSHRSTIRSLCLVNLAELCSFDYQILQPCLRNTNIVRNIICVMTDASYSKLFNVSNRDNFNKMHKNFMAVSITVSACADLLAFMLARDQLKCFDDGRENSAFGCVSNLIRDPVVISASIVASMTTYFHFVAVLASDVVCPDVFQKFVLSLLRLLMLVLNTPAWRAGLGLVEADTEEHPTPNKYFPFGADLFASLIALQAASISSSITDAVVTNAMYTALSCMLQHSLRLREHFQSEVSPLVKRHGGRRLKVRPIKGAEEEILSSTAIVIAHTLDVILFSDTVEVCDDLKHPLSSESITGKAGGSKSKTVDYKNRSRTNSKCCRRDMVRGFQFTTPQHQDAPPPCHADSSQLWSAMLFFVGAFKQSKNQDVLNAIGLPNALVRLLRDDSNVIKCFSLSSHCDRSSKNCTKCEHAKLKYHQIESLTLSAMATFVIGSSTGKHASLSSPAARASTYISLLGKDDSVNRSILPCRLLCLGLRSGEEFANRLLALRLLETFARDNLHGSATLRTTIHNNVILALRNDLKAASQSSPDCLPPAVFSGLLDVLGSVLLLPSETQRTSSTSPTETQAKTMRVRVEQNRVIGQYQSTAPYTKAALSIPELVKWTYERYHTCSTILLSLIRFIGRICSENSFVRNQNHWTVACRKTFAVVLSEEVLDTVFSCCSSVHDPAIRGLALAALWFVLHRSERARSYFKSKRDLQNDFNFPHGKAKYCLQEEDENILHAEKMVFCLFREN